MKYIAYIFLILFHTTSIAQSTIKTPNKLIGIWSVKKSKTNKPYQKWLLNEYGEFFLLKNPNNLDTNSVLRAGFYKLNNDTLKISSWKSSNKHTLVNQYPKTTDLYFLFKIQGNDLILFDPNKSKKKKYKLTRLF